MDWDVPLFKTYNDEADVDAVREVIERGTYWATGPEITEFEEEFAEYVGREYALAMNSGTSALQALLAAEDISGGEVIVPSFSFVATANVVLLSGAEPVFADIEPDTYGLDPDDVQEKITADTQAIMPMHYGGRTSKEISALQDIAEDQGIPLIEDAAESLGSERDGTPSGGFGKSAMFSLCQNKVISTGEGGMVVTDSEELYERLRLIRSHGRVSSREGEYFSSTADSDYVRPGYNFRMPTMGAALGLSQLEKIDEIIEMRREHAQTLNDRLKDIEELRVPAPVGNEKHVYQMYTVELEDEETRDELQEHLKKAGVMTKTYWATPIHEKSLYDKKGIKKTSLSTTSKVCNRVLTLPLFPDMTQEQINLIAESTREYFL